MKNSERGSIQTTLLLFLVIFTSAGFGILTYFHRWHELARIQIHLDSCVENAAHLLERNLSRLHQSNSEIILLRSTIAILIPGSPEALALEATLVSTASLQEALLAEWKLKRILWLTPSHCYNTHDQAVPLPEISVIRAPPDTLGPQPLEWENPAEKSFRIEIRNQPRASAALVFSNGESQNGNPNWQSKWTNFH